MNIKTYILGLGALSMVAMSSCDTDNVRSIYENSTAGITFLTAEQEESFPEKATELAFNVDVVRQNGEGDATINLISKYMKKNANKLEETTWNDKINVPSSVTFKDGETTASFQVSLEDDIEQGIAHYVNVTLDTEEAPLDANMSKLLTISRDYTYKSIGEKALTSEWLSDTPNGTKDINVEVEQGTQATEIYRVVNVYKNPNDKNEDGSEDKNDYPMIITLSTDKEGEKIASVAETKVSLNLTVSSVEDGSTWDDDKITLKMKFVDTKKGEETTTTEIFKIEQE